MTTSVTLRNACLVLATIVTLFAAGPARAEVNIDIFGPGQTRLKLSVAEPLRRPAQDALPPQAAELSQLLQTNINFLPFFERVPDEAILGGTTLDGFQLPDVDLKRFQLAGADLLLTTGWVGPETVELRVYEVFTGSIVVGKAYPKAKGDALPVVADKFCAALMEKLTGHGDFFRSAMAFVKRDGESLSKNIWTVSPTGSNLQQITQQDGICLSPDWSVDGRYIVFSHIGDRYHSLGIWDRLSGRVRTVKFPGNTIIGPTFTPDNKIAVGMAMAGNPDIYLINHMFKKEKPLVDNWAIDVSPSLSDDGTKMAFVSSRLGNPHIFLKDMDTNETRRVTTAGSYNTHPSISPDGSLVVFTRMTGDGHRIFLHDLKSGLERQLTFGPGSDEEPSFAPDGYFLAFTSNRSGNKQIYLTTRHGDPAKLVPTGPGDAEFPAWGRDPGKQ